MAEEEVLLPFNPQDFVIKVTPVLRDKSWTGEVNVSIVIADDM